MKYEKQPIKSCSDNTQTENKRHSLTINELNADTIKPLTPEKLSSAAPLFNGWEETIIYSCLQGIMGNIYTTNDKHPTSASAVLGDFCFLAGEPDIRLIKHNYNKDFLIMVGQNEGWAELIEKTLKTEAVKRTRYAFKKEPNCFDIQKLREFSKKLPSGFEVKKIDEELYNQCLKYDWSSPLVYNFRTYEEYKKSGLGYMITYKNKIVSGASSYSRYKDGIEIEIDTHEDFRRKGLALVCAASLITECLSRNLYPSWDAHNPVSVALAKKLGYHFSHEYTAYEIVKNK